MLPPVTVVAGVLRVLFREVRIELRVVSALAIVELHGGRLGSGGSLRSRVAACEHSR